jgi:hypothetical protein
MKGTEQVGRAGGWCWAAAGGMLLLASLALLLAVRDPGWARNPEPGPRPAPAALQAAPAPPEELLPPPRTLGDGGGARPPARSQGARTFGTLPPATHEAADLLQRYVAPVRVAERDLDLILGRPRLLHLREPPFRIQVDDERTFRYTVLGPPTELSLLGHGVGSTGMTLWFGDRNDPAAQTILRFRVRVFP